LGGSSSQCVHTRATQWRLWIGFQVDPGRFDYFDCLASFECSPPPPHGPIANRLIRKLLPHVHLARGSFNFAPLGRHPRSYDKNQWRDRNVNLLQARTSYFVGFPDFSSFPARVALAERKSRISFQTCKCLAHYVLVSRSSFSITPVFFLQIFLPKCTYRRASTGFRNRCFQHLREIIHYNNNFHYSY
jgi:hypothetical protein